MFSFIQSLSRWSFDYFLEQDEILRLSEKYVRSLSKDSQNIIDGPFAGRLTGYGKNSLYGQYTGVPWDKNHLKIVRLLKEMQIIFCRQTHCLW